MFRCELWHILDADLSPSGLISSRILHFVHQLRQYKCAIATCIKSIRSLCSSPELACRLLERFLLQRLVPHGNEEWITKSFITLLWLSTTMPSQHLQPAELSSVFADLFTAWKRSLSPEATHGVLVVRGLKSCQRTLGTDRCTITSCSGSASRTTLTTVTSRIQ
jgi:Meiosis protein SPO22/ZIP4 like